MGNYRMESVEEIIGKVVIYLALFLFLVLTDIAIGIGIFVMLGLNSIFGDFFVIASAFVGLLPLVGIMILARWNT